MTQRIGGGEVLERCWQQYKHCSHRSACYYSLRDAILPIPACCGMPDVMNSSERRFGRICRGVLTLLQMVESESVYIYLSENSKACAPVIGCHWHLGANQSESHLKVSDFQMLSTGLPVDQMIRELRFSDITRITACLPRLGTCSSSRSFSVKASPAAGNTYHCAPLTWTTFSISTNVCAVCTV